MCTDPKVEQVIHTDRLHWTKSKKDGLGDALQVISGVIMSVLYIGYHGELQP